jgi:hypothetical protein
LHTDLLFRFGIPLIIQYSKIGRISVKIPIAITKNPVKITLENVDINLKGIDEFHNNQNIN